MEDSGGKWADFGDTGEYETKNPEDAEKLRNAPNFGKDFYEVGVERKGAEEKPKVMYKCPFCDYTNSVQQSVVTHCTFKKDDSHKKITVDEVLVV